MLLYCCRLELALSDAAGAKEQFEGQNQTLSDLEGEVGLLRRRLGSLENERDKERALNKKLQEALNLARTVRTISFHIIPIMYHAVLNHRPYHASFCSSQYSMRTEFDSIFFLSTKRNWSYFII